MISSIYDADSGAVQLAMAAMYQKMNSANTDGISGLSKDELSSIDTSGDVGASAFLKSLTDQFDKLDADANGQLSEKEIAFKKLPEQMGPPPGMEISSSDTANSANSLDDIIKKMLKQLEDGFDNATEKGASTAPASTDSVKSLLSGFTAVDSDAIAGLSLDEISSVDTSNNSKKANFIKDLTTNFDKIDSDKNGQLSQSEIVTSASDYIDSSQNTRASNFGSSLGSFSGAFIQKLVSSYKDGGLSTLANSLNLAV